MQRLLPISPNTRRGLIGDAKAIATGGCSQMILREPGRTRWEIEQVLPELKKLLPGLILHVNNVNAWRFAEIHQTGLHLPSHADPRLWRSRFDGLLGMSCHQEAQVLAAQQNNLDYVLLSPVFSPLSKVDDRTPLGPTEAARVQSLVSIPVFALGGIQARNAKQCKGCFGGASMGYLFGNRTNRKQLYKRTKSLLNIFDNP
jgi:thiamine-phosphate pyrophosphorylase